MAHFSYTAQKSDGEVYKGLGNANDRFELYQIVRREGGKILTVTEENENGIWSMAWWNAKLTRVSDYEKILFARNLGAMLAAGLPLARALAVQERQTKNQKLINTLSQLSSDVRRGDSLHVALAKSPKVFSKLFVAMVRSGEEGGNLSEALTLASDQMDRMLSLKKKVRGAMIYPLIIVTAIVGIGAFMMIKVVPTLAKTFTDMHVSLPLSTQIIIGISNFLSHDTLLTVGIVGAIIAVFYFGLKTKSGKRAADFLVLRIPAIGTIAREINAARTSRTLASLLSSGVDVMTALEISGEVVQNSYFKEVIELATHNIGAGETLSSAFSKNESLYPAFVGEMMAVGEETGKTNEMLKRLAIFYEEEVDRKTKDMSTIIEPFLMLIIGGTVGFFAVSMIAPIYSISNNI